MEATLSMIKVCGGIGFMLMVLTYAWRFFNWVWLIPKNTEKCLRDQGLKGTPYKFLFGDVREIVKVITEASLKPINITDDILPRVLSFVHNSVTTYGKNCFIWAGPKPILNITDPTMIQEMLAKYEDYEKVKGANPLISLLAKGLAQLEGDHWLKHRKIINPAFHVEKLKHMVPAFYMSCDEMIKIWEETLKEESSCEMDVWPHLQTMTSDAISRTAFGSSFVEGKKIFELQRELADLIVTPFNILFYIPGSRFLPTKFNKRIKAIAQEATDSVRGIIDKRVTEMKSGKGSRDDLLGILLDSNNKEIEQHGNNNGLSINNIIEECKLFYFAGQETTATLLVWTMILLAQHRNWQERARDEALKVFGERKPDIDGLIQLKIINIIFLEVLRLYPPIVGLARMIHKETKLGNITLPAGSLIQLHTMLLHYDPNIWGNDVKDFNPERFSQGVSKVTKGQPVYIPFGGGPRVCIGQNFAMLEAKMTLVMILSRFSFDLSPSYVHAPRTIITLKPQFGAHLIIRKLPS